MKRGGTPGSGRNMSRRERKEREGLTRKGNRNSRRKISWKAGETGSKRKENDEDQQNQEGEE